MKSIYKLRNITGKITLSSIALLGAFAFTLLFTSSLKAQIVTTYTKPSFWVGAAGGANLNYYRGNTQVLNSDFTTPAAFGNGYGAGVFLAATFEYYKPNTVLGFILQGGYDSRRGKFDQKTTPCNCPSDLNTDLSYITIEPSLRVVPFESNFYLFAGPRLGFNLERRFRYSQGPNPNFPNQPVNEDVKGDFSRSHKEALSGQIGMGLDIPLTTEGNQTQLAFSPFVSYHPRFGQNPRAIETWNLSTLRIGASLKIGSGKAVEPDMVVTAPDPEVRFTVNSPSNIPVERRFRETFPIRNYVFFDKNSTNVPSRYALLQRSQVADFKEDQLEMRSEMTKDGRAKRSMNAYYNVLNILGDRMGKTPSSNITLVGSSENGIDEAKLMAESVKSYLVNVFGISSSRIGIEGRISPVNAASAGATTQMDLRKEGDRRVTIVSSSSDLLMEFQTGPDAPLRPIVVSGMQVAPIDSYVTFNVDNSMVILDSWSLEARDSQGNVQFFGPYKQDKVSIPGKNILGARPSGDYKFTMVGTTKNGNIVRKDANAKLNLWTPPKDEEGMRFSILYDYDDSKAITIYEKYLTDIVVPKIPMNASVTVHGYTDILGDANYNLTLSQSRANDVKNIIQKALDKAGRKDVRLDVLGFGEDENLSPFNNVLPEERSYNRTVIIDILPKK